MKKLKLIIVYFLFATIAMTQTGCFGTFALTKKAWEFNKSVGEKFAQEAVFLIMCIIPVYQICTLIDAVILNLIEFWSGSNPLAMNAGEVDVKTMAFHGSIYKVTAMQNKFIVEKQKGDTYVMMGKLEYKNKAWYSNSGNKEHKLVGYNENGQVQVFSKDNKVYTMNRNLASAELLKKMVNNETYASK